MPEPAPGGLGARLRLRRALSGGYRSFLEIFVLCGFALAQPVLEVMGRSPAYFIFRQADVGQIIFLAVTLVVAPPVVLWMAETAFGMVGASAQRAVSILIRSGLVGVIGLQVLRTLTGFDGPGLLLAGGVAAGAGMVALLRYRATTLWLRYLIPAPVVFAVLFLSFSPVSDLVWHSGPATATPGAVQTEAPVVVVLLDELPLGSLLDGQGEIDARLYPNFARLRQGSTWFRNTTSAASYTPLAVPALLSGRNPHENLAPTAARFPETLFTLLAGSHDLVAYETVTALCPPRACQTTDAAPGGSQVLLKDAARVWEGIMSPGQSRRDVIRSLWEETTRERQERFGGTGGKAQPDSADDVWFGAGWTDENQPARFSDFVATLDGNRRPTLWFLHLLLPHGPLRYLPSGLQYEREMFGYGEDGVLTRQSWPALHLRQRHMLQTIYADALLGQVLDRLQATGIHDRALLVVVADHGQDISPGRHGRTLDGNLADLAWVPFFVKAPGQQSGEVSDANVQIIDLVPTVADILGVAVPWQIDGISAVGPTPRPDGTRPFYDGKTGITFQTDDWFPRVLRGWSESLGRSDLGPEGLFAIGPFADLVGSRVADHPMAGSGPARATVDELDAYTKIDPASGRLPALVSGQVDDPGPLDGSYSVAVAINGTIGGVSELFQDGDIPRRFAAMVSDSRFVPGENKLELYLVTRDRGRPTLSPVHVAG